MEGNNELVVVLDGSESQTLVIESKRSHATMKDVEDGIEKYIQNRRISAFQPIFSRKAQIGPAEE